jgi:TatD DNase family protein
MLDIHTHLYWDSYDDDRDEVIARARAAGVRQMLVVGTTLAESQKAIILAEQYEDVYASVGIHPNEWRDSEKVKAQNAQWWEELKVLAENPKVVAIGECGLDYSESHGLITEEQKECQKEAFLRQIALATELHLPLIIHCRPTNNQTQDAYQDLLSILEAKSSKLKAVILHCYMGDTVVTQEFFKLSHLYFSFTGNITYPVKKDIIGTKDDLTETVRMIPKERIFVETDCPFLSPQAKRGERNEPAYVVHTGEKVCELLSIDREALDIQLAANFVAVFGKSQID